MKSKIMKLGIDLGSSVTDAILMDKNQIINTYSSMNVDIYKIINIFQSNNTQEIEELCLTGYGSLNQYSKISGIKVKKINEIDAIGLGGSYISNLPNTIVVSIGSGTCIVSKKGNSIEHIGGTAIGGKTLTGLASLLIGINDHTEIENLASNGNLKNIDLILDNIYPMGIGLLPPDATASHFGNLKNASNSDIALGIINMIAQTIGTLAVFAAKSENLKNIVLTGRLTKIKKFREIIETRINTLHKIKVSMPPNAEFSTAIGAILAANNSK